MYSWWQSGEVECVPNSKPAEGLEAGHLTVHYLFSHHLLVHFSFYEPVEFIVRNYVTIRHCKILIGQLIQRAYQLPRINQSFPVD
jgi:hypothetical protein